MNKNILILSILLFFIALSANASANICQGEEDSIDCGDCCLKCSLNNWTEEYDETQNNDCTDLNEINTCTYEPDANPFTLDYHPSVENVCVDLFTCSNPDYDNESISHTCNMSECNAQCEESKDCEAYLGEGMPQNVLDVPLESPSNPTCYYSGYCFGDCTCGYEGQEECEGPELIEGNCYFGYDCTEEGCEHNSTETCPNTKLEDDVCYYDHDCTEEGCEYSQNETCPPFKEEEGFCEFNPICVYQETDLLDSQEVCSYQNSISMDNYTDCTAEGPKDLMPPITSIIGGGYTNLWTNQTDWHIFFQAEDGESWVTDSLWRVNDNNWANVPNSNSENPFEFDKEFTLDEGNHTLEYYSIDYSNNQEETHQRPIKIDLTNPEVNAGPDKSSTGSVNVDATTSDNLSGIETYSWTKESGPGEVTFSNPNQEDTEISADETGTYKIRLTVTDNAGNTNYDELNYEKEKKSSSSGGGPVKRCSPNWECTEWSECSQQGKQIRTCTDLENCRTNRDKPKEEKNCTYEEESEQETEPEQEPVIPEPVIPENNQTGNSTNSTDSNGPEGITGAAIGDIQVNPLGDFFKNFWNWFLNFFNF